MIATGAGTESSTAGDRFREADSTGKVINMRPYKDPRMNSSRNLGKEVFQERTDQVRTAFYFEIRILSEQYDQKPRGQSSTWEIAQKCEFRKI